MIKINIPLLGKEKLIHPSLRDTLLIFEWIGDEIVYCNLQKAFAGWNVVGQWNFERTNKYRLSAIFAAYLEYQDGQYSDSDLKVLIEDTHTSVIVQGGLYDKDVLEKIVEERNILLTPFLFEL
jgi:hypothetical protein